MNKFILMATSLSLMMPSCKQAEDETEDHNNGTVDEKSNSEAKKAFILINDIRKNPSAYSSQMGVDLSEVEVRNALNWDDALAKVAQEKAEDMANNNYFSHTDLNGYGVNYFMYEAGYDIPESWRKNKSDNYFENIAAGHSTAEATVKQLIYDSGADNSSAGHRASLLGISNWCSNCTDIGIGYAYNVKSTYKHYWSIIIAKHK